MNYIDLFAGAGGLSEGFLRAGFHAIAHIDMDPDAVNTLKTRQAYWYLKKRNRLSEYYAYLQGKISREKLYSGLPKSVLSTVLEYKMNEKNLKMIFNMIDTTLKTQPYNDHIHLIVGGPPCQAYSLACRGRRKSEEKQKTIIEDDDHRKYLYKLYCKFLQHYQPDMFVFENVPGLLGADNGEHWAGIQAMLQASGYIIESNELNAKDFGVPQDRKRIIIIGWRKGTKHNFPVFEETNPYWNLQDILSDLPAIQPGEQKNNYQRGRPHGFVDKNLRTEGDVLTWHIARPHIERDRTIYRRAINDWINKNHTRLNYKDIPKHLQTHKNITGFSDRFKVVPPDLPYCHTMLSHIAKDGHYYIYPDIDQARSLTVREAARIQSFPDNYFFEGSRTSAFVQIGNAVPPLMAQKIAEALSKQLSARRYL